MIIAKFTRTANKYILQILYKLIYDGPYYSVI